MTRKHPLSWNWVCWMSCRFSVVRVALNSIPAVKASSSHPMPICLGTWHYSISSCQLKATSCLASLTIWTLRYIILFFPILCSVFISFSFFFFLFSILCLQEKYFISSICWTLFFFILGGSGYSNKCRRSCPMAQLYLSVCSNDEESFSLWHHIWTADDGFQSSWLPSQIDHRRGQDSRWGHDDSFQQSRRYSIGIHPTSPLACIYLSTNTKRDSWWNPCWASCQSLLFGAWDHLAFQWASQSPYEWQRAPWHCISGKHSHSHTHSLSNKQ